MELAIDVEKKNKTTKVKLTGELDVFTATKLKNKLIPLTEQTGETIQIDLKNTRYLDSTGLGVFISAYKSSKQHESRLIFVHLNERIKRLFTVTGLHEIMNIADDALEKEGE